MLLLVLAMPVMAADAPRHGLMWNRTGLPLVFPLVVRTDPGRSYHVLLREVDTGEAALAAYIEGGRYFRVLTPPGTYRVEISHGQDWVSEEQLFGARTGLIRVAEPLTFQVESFTSKGGHFIDLRGYFSDEASLRVLPVQDCQTVDWVTDTRRATPAEAPPKGRKEGLLVLRGPLEALREDLALDLVYPDADRGERAPLWRFVGRVRDC